MNKLSYILSTVFITTLISCGGGKDTSIEAESVAVDSTLLKDSTKVDDLAEFKFQTTIANIPYPPADMYAAITKTGAAYDANLVNKKENLSKYATTAKRSLNYGVYSVDLIYLATTEKLGEAKGYLSVCRNLAKQLDMLESFDKIAKNHVEQSPENKDTVLKVVNEVYAATDTYLRSNERLNVATQILVGSWIESQFVTLNILKSASANAQNAPLFNKVYEQKLHLGNLCNLLKEFEKEKDMQTTIADLNALNAEYAKMKTEADAQTMIGNLLAKVTALRTKITS